MKRILDIVVSTTVLLIFSPLFAFVAILVNLNLGRPILYRQKRPGLREKPFTIYKFRTMIDLRDRNGELLPDSSPAPLSPADWEVFLAALDNPPTLSKKMKQAIAQERKRIRAQSAEE